MLFISFLFASGRSLFQIDNFYIFFTSHVLLILCSGFVFALFSIFFNNNSFIADFLPLYAIFFLFLSFLCLSFHFLLYFFPDFSVLFLDFFHLLKLVFVGEVALDHPQGALNEGVGFVGEVYLGCEFVDEQQGKVHEGSHVVLADSAEASFGELVCVGLQHELGND